MAQYLAFTARDVPELGGQTEGTLYRGDHASEAVAADAAATVLGVGDSGLIWVTLMSTLTRYVVTAGKTYDANAG